MTQKKFESKFKKENKQDNIWNYIISILTIIAGIFIFEKLAFTNYYELKFEEKNGKILSKNILYLSSLILIIIGTYGFWRIPKLYFIKKIKGKSIRNENELLIIKCAQKFKMTLIEKEEEFYSYHYIGKFKNPFHVFLFADENGNILINVQKIDYDGGFIDLGTSRRVKNKIIKEIKNACL
ncbi:hypothetical protein [Kaistella sp.]|uniref:hypothetical protein n=1 Tax=Kaistella sp. TaxID=2782235 RepID=UPI00359F56B5